jgi:hypothetical protein
LLFVLSFGLPAALAAPAPAPWADDLIKSVTGGLKQEPKPEAKPASQDFDKIFRDVMAKNGSPLDKPAAAPSSTDFLAALSKPAPADTKSAQSFDDIMASLKGAKPAAAAPARTVDEIIASLQKPAEIKVPAVAATSAGTDFDAILAKLQSKPAAVPETPKASSLEDIIASFKKTTASGSAAASISDFKIPEIKIPELTKTDFKLPSVKTSSFAAAATDTSTSTDPAKKTVFDVDIGQLFENSARKAEDKVTLKWQEERIKDLEKETAELREWKHQNNLVTSVGDIKEKAAVDDATRSLDRAKEGLGKMQAALDTSKVKPLQAGASYAEMAAQLVAAHQAALAQAATSA